VRLRVLYRSTGPGNLKRRPPFFDKALCLASFLRSVETVEGPEIVFLNDGQIPPPRLKAMNEVGQVLPLTGIGNSASYRLAVSMATRKAYGDDDLVFLAEDDYLYLPEAFPVLLASVQALPSVTYFSPYDHVDRYRRTDDADRGLSRIVLAGGHHWRTAESTCMTYLARVGGLRRDSWIHRAGSRNISPRDRLIWRAVQRIGRFRILPRRQGGRRHRLVSALPALATHVEDGQLAPVIDWENVALDTREWASRAGMMVSDDSPA
jgi:hypothetical protein